MPNQYNRNYTLNENYFDIIDTEEKAYILGILYADGYNNTKRTNISISLKEADKEILERLSLAVGSNRPLSYRVSRNTNHCNQYTFCISSKHISSRLSELGCIRAKSTILTFPEWINSELVRHFIRGYFDGDGCIHIGKRQTVVNLTGTSSLITAIQDILIKEIRLKKTKLQGNKRGNNSILTMQYSGRLQAKRIAEWLYKDSSIYLQRKFDKFKEITK